MTRAILRWLLALFMIVAGANHFLDPAPYLGIMPPQLPWPVALINISGIAEIAGGLGILLPLTRRAAAWGLIALFLAVFPANIYGALHGMVIDGAVVPEWVLWLRLPFQLVFIAWAWWSCGLSRKKA